MRFTIGLLFALAACGHKDAVDTAADADGDGWSAGVDCDDDDPSIHPEALDLCNGENEDCDNLIDEDGTSVWYLDYDRDGYGDVAVELCDELSRASAVGGDCDDGDADIHPAADEVCDGIDNDCDGAADDADPEGPADGAEGYRDADGDGYGVDDAFGLWCEPAARGGDCDDDDPGVPQGVAWYADADGDGYGDESAPVDPCETDAYVESGRDCDDTDDTIHPDARELCEPVGIDEDCDGLVDADDSDSGCFSYELTVSLNTADAMFRGESHGDAAGWSVAGTGDVDGDGLDDVLIGAPDNDEGGTAAGAAYLVLSAVSASLSSADARFLGDNPGVTSSNGDDAGYRVAGAGDVNADGYADLLVSAPEADAGGKESGAAYLIWGPVSGDLALDDADATLIGPNSSASAGYGLAGAGDVNGDGFDDVFVGAPGAQDASGAMVGAAYVGLGPLSGAIDLGDAEAALFGGSRDDSLAQTVAAAGDVNGDGLADLLVGAHTTDGYTGAAYLLQGPVSGTLALVDAETALFGEDANDFAGQAVAGAGDVDGDGLDDLLIGAYGESSRALNNGAAYLVLAVSLGVSVDLGSADATLTGESVEALAGHAVAGAGDVDDDGFDDVLVGAPYHSDAGRHVGAAYLALGPISGELLLSEVDFQLTGVVPDSYAGYGAVAGAGDVDGDGLADLLIGAYGNNATYLVLGGDLLP